MKSIQIAQGFQKCNEKQQTMMCRMAKNSATASGAGTLQVDVSVVEQARVAFQVWGRPTASDHRSVFHHVGLHWIQSLRCCVISKFSVLANFPGTG
jgi:aspartate/tyrosine/aromatic aminotransferase